MNYAAFMNIALQWVWDQLVTHHELIFAAFGAAMLAAAATMPRDWSEGFWKTLWGWFYAWTQEMVSMRSNRVASQANVQLAQAGAPSLQMTSTKPEPPAAPTMEQLETTPVVPPLSPTHQPISPNPETNIEAKE